MSRIYQTPRICNTLLNTGACNDDACTFNHTVYRCEPCNVFVATPWAYQSHVEGKKHKKTVRGHHAAPARNQIHCAPCHTNVPHYDWASHCSGLKHKAREQYVVFQAALEEGQKDKHGVVVSGEFDLGMVEPTAAQVGVVVRASIQNTTPGSKVSLISLAITSDKGTNKKSPFTVKCDHSGVLSYNTAYPFSVTLQQGFLGRAEDLLEIVFEDTQLRKRFAIVRTLSAHVGSLADHEAIGARAPYVPRKRAQRPPEAGWSLPHAPIPTNLASILGSGDTKTVSENVRSLYLPRAFDSNGYGRHFKHLLWVEEHRMENDLGLYDISGTQLSRYQAYYYLEVPGLAEKRPSVLVGDRILVQHQGAADSGRWFEGGVHVVRQKEVGLRFNGLFRSSPADLFSVRFKLNRYPLRRQHLALDSAFSEDRVLFPVAAHVPRTPIPTSRNTIVKVSNALIATNPAQLQAVMSIVKRPAGSVPFIIFGPPGTGKTVTAVEAIRQVLAASPNARVLACAPSNSAADLIASRLMELGNEVLFRFYAPSRHKEQVDLGLREFTHVTADGHFSVPPLAIMKRFRVIVTTCVSASVVSGIGIPRGHYSHIFIDEAGQATEPEAMIAIQTMADNNTNIVLSGDPKQLGPIIRSPIARELGLEISYIERLMQRDVYDEQAGYGKTVVKLTQNFRSHPSILKFPNEQFYRGELEPHGDRKVTELYANSPLLPKRGFPIIFHSLAGKDDREASSPSFFNIDEASQVRTYVEILRGDSKHGVRTGVRITDADIGVIAPYHAQCLKIRTLLRTVAEGVKVGSVEEFQGQERKVIIISTVRSSREFVSYDLRHTLGFVANPRRFNVAVTRAQSLLIVVGDPNVLGLDPLWRSFLNYVYTNGGWTGADIPWDASVEVDAGAGNAYADQARSNAVFDMNDFTRRMEELTVAAGAEGDGDDVNVDRPWREAE
ncbi:RNA helicase [Mycena chlorophos]|uniref:RNA helicase n=1 Tax=Mycena chlorophos TaxID=658473 RepID=A0A8H6TKD1_MYCCL|nr:RNA helicase [Mycena chlorophos]